MTTVTDNIYLISSFIIFVGRNKDNMDAIRAKADYVKFINITMENDFDSFVKLKLLAAPLMLFPSLPNPLMPFPTNILKFIY